MIVLVMATMDYSWWSVVLVMFNNMAFGRCVMLNDMMPWSRAMASAVSSRTSECGASNRNAGNSCNDECF
jgi:hypothetical protein